MTIRGEDFLITGAWALLIGSAIETIGQTQQSLTGSDLGKDLVIKGNGIEALGNSLQAIGRTKMVPPEVELWEIYTILGAWLEAAGNTANAVGIDIEVNASEEEGIKIDTLGSGVQALGAAFEAVGASLTKDTSYKSLSITGNSFISFGSLLTAVGNIFIINNKNKIGEQMLLVGSWIQVSGSIILVHAITLEVESVLSSENRISDSYSYFFTM